MANPNLNYLIDLELRSVTELFDDAIKNTERLADLGMPTELICEARERQTLLENLHRMLRCLSSDRCSWELDFRIAVSLYVGEASRIRDDYVRVQCFDSLSGFSAEDVDPRGEVCLVCGCAHSEFNDKYEAICCYCASQHEQHAVKKTGCKAAFCYGFVDWRSICAGKIEEGVCEFHKQHFENLQRQKVKNKQKRQRRKKNKRNHV